MAIPQPIRDAHRRLSPEALLFLEHVEKRPELSKALDSTRTAVSDWARDFASTVQPWPILVDAPMVAEIERATVGVSNLVRRIPERVFGGNADQMAAYYGVRDPQLLALGLTEPNGLPGSFSRLDLILGEDGFKALEVNLVTLLGGWDSRNWVEAVRHQPPMASFLREHDVDARFRDILEVLYPHVAREAIAAGHATGDEVNLAIVFDSRGFLSPDRSFTRVYEKVLQDIDPALSGQAMLATYPHEVEERGDQLVYQGKPIHAVIEHTAVPTPAHVYRAFKEGRVHLYNGPVAPILSDKRSISLISEQAHRFTPEEQAIIEDHIPWSRVVAHSEVTWRGESHSMLELLHQQREHFVLKRGQGASGKAVVVGRFQEKDEWAGAVQVALDEGWAVQEWVESLPYYFQHGEHGARDQSLIWGMFSFGDLYGGGFMRMLPRGEGGGIINSTQGASEGLLFEV